MRLRGGSRLRYRTGSSRGRYVQGAEVPTTIDTGTLFITNKRVVFQGIKQSRECRFDKTMGISLEARTGTLVVSVSNRQKPTIVRYGRKVADWVAFRLELAMAHNQGRLPAYISQLEQGLVEIDRQKPAAPVVEQPSWVKDQPQAREPTNSNVVGSQRAIHNVQGQPRVQNAGRALAILVLVILVLVIWAVTRGPNSPYNDGYQWGEANTVGILSKTAPSCSRTEMVSGAEVVDPNFIFNKPLGDNKPNDNFSQWQAGCEAAAQSVIASFNN